jgi:hypothetical protein
VRRCEAQARHGAARSPLELEPRAAALTALLTPQEKAAWLQNGQAALPRLNLSSWEFGAEALHGLQGHCITAPDEQTGLKEGENSFDVFDCGGATNSTALPSVLDWENAPGLPSPLTKRQFPAK